MTTTATNIEQQELPAGWKWVKLGDVSNASSGSTPSRNIPEYWNGDIPWAKIQDISATGKWITTTSEQITQSAFTQTSVKLFPKNTVLIAMYGASIGKTCITANPMTTNQAILGCICNENTVPDFLWYWIQIIQEDLIAMGQGGAQPNVNAGIIKGLNFPLPPLEEQKRIAGILNEQMAAVEEAKKAAQQRLEAVKALPAAYLREVFEGEEAKGWEISPLSESFKLQTGFAFKSHWFKETGIRLLRNANVMPQTIDWSNVVYLSEKMADDYSRFDLNQGDIVLSLDRPLVSAGLKVARINSEDLPAILVQRVGRFISKKTANEDFLYLFLNSDTFIRQITGHDQSIGVPHISPQQVMSVVMPLPDVTKQTQITKWLDDKFFATSIAEASIQQELDTIEAMPAALLRKAFSGGL